MVMTDLRIDQQYFDCIFYGTGLHETILSAALQRAGLSVLLIDRNLFYGSQWATLSFKEFDSFVKSAKFENSQTNSPGIYSLKFENNAAFTNFECSDVDPEIRSKLRSFQLDLFPFLVPSAGPFLEKILKTGIFKYLSFQLVDGILVRDQGHDLVEAPCSRSELFSTDYFTNIEKYRLNKFFKICGDFSKSFPPNQDGVATKFIDFMRENELTPKLVEYICSLICLQDRQIDLKSGLVLLFDFINSAGIYGKSPFLWTLYGCGDIIQAFSRHGAIYGGTCCLNMSIDNLILVDGSCCGVRLANGEEIKCKHFFINDSYLASRGGSPSSETLQRTILFTNKSINPQENLKLLHQFRGDSVLTVLELPFMSGTCPKEYYVVHFTAHGGTRDQLMEVIREEVESLYGGVGVLWRGDFELCCGDYGGVADLPLNVNVCRGPSVFRSCNDVMEHVREMFSTICPEEEFLPHVDVPSEDQEFI